MTSIEIFIRVCNTATMSDLSIDTPRNEQSGLPNLEPCGGPLTKLNSRSQASAESGSVQTRSSFFSCYLGRSS
jgi:hypothetical protein